MIFASAGYKVSLYDVLREQIENAKNNIQNTLQDYHSKGCLKGNLSPEEQFGLISGEFKVDVSRLSWGRLQNFCKFYRYY